MHWGVCISAKISPVNCRGDTLKPPSPLLHQSHFTLSLAGKMAIKNHFIMTHLNTPVSNPLLRQKPIVRPPQSFSSGQIVGTDIEVC